MTPTQQNAENAFPTYAKFMEEYNPAQLIVVYADINTIAKSVAVKFPRLKLEDVSIIYSNGKRNAGVDYMDAWLAFLNKLSNLNKQLTETKAVAFMLYKDYKSFYLTDLKIIFEKILRCDYGIFYGSVDAPRIFGAFAAYARERAETYQRIREHIEKERRAYMAPLEEAQWTAIQKRLEGKYTDEKMFWEECRRIYNQEAYPEMVKLSDEIEEDIIKKIQ